MFFNSYSIFIYIILFTLVYNLVKHFVKIRIVRNLIIIIANFLVLLTIVREHTLIVISIFSLFIFFTGNILQKRSSISLLSFLLLFVITLFSIRNYPNIQEIFSNSYLSFVNTPILSVQKIGLSYIIFRYVHWLVESYKKTVHNSDFLTFLNYILFFPSFLAGPIDQYNNFHYWLGNKNSNYHKSLFFSGVSRIFIGAIKTLGIVPLIIQYATDYTILIPDFSPLGAISLSLLAYSAYIYLDFSGYSDIAIGTAYLMGMKTPENFNNPYISRDLSEFWKRWHITFSMFLKLYVFKPFIRLYNKLCNPKYRLAVSILGYLSTFLICGLWHGNTVNFAYWGLWHGIGLSINKVWKVKIKPILPFCDGATYKFISIFITFIYVTIGWVFFHYPMEQLAAIFKLVL